MNQEKDIKKNNNNKTNRQFSENLILKFKKIQPVKTSNLAQRRRAKIFIPTPISSERQKFNIGLPFASNISLISSRKEDSKNEVNNTIDDIYKNILNNNCIKEKLLLKKPEIKIQKHSMNQNITPSENCKKIRIKIYKVPRKIPKSNDGKNLKVIDIKKIKDIRKKTKNIFNMNKDNNMTTINISNNDKKNKEKDLTLINNYNIMQKESLKILSNQLENLIINRKLSKSENHGIINCNESNSKNEATFENTNYKNGCYTNVYRRKVKRKKNNYIDSFSETDYPNIMPKIKLKDLNKSQIINQQNCNNLHINNILINGRKKFIFKRNYFQNLNNTDSIPLNGTRSVKNNIPDTYGLIKSKINRKYTNPNINNNNTININRNYLSVTRPIKKYINTENNNLISNNKANTFNGLDTINSDYKILDTTISNNNYTDFRYKNKFHFNNQKDNNYNKNTMEIEEGSITPDNEYSLNLNYFLNNNDNKKTNLTNKWTTLYSNMSSQYNTINTLNNSENPVFKPNYSLNFKGNHNLNNVAPIKANKKIYYFNNNKMNKLPNGNNYNSKKKIYIKNSLIKRKKNISKNSKDKKLKNVITSIEYCNKNNKSYNSTKKNIILSEVNNSGKINVRIREMENSIEKLIKENSLNSKNNMPNNNFDLPSPKKWNEDITYVKKNQGTHFKKIKKHNTVNHLNYYYPPPVPLK